MKQQFITYEIALKLKELGFDEECLYAYYHKSDLKNFKENHYMLVGDRNNTQLTDGRISAPLWQQVIDWFRVKYNVLIIVYSNASGYLFEFSDAEGGTHRYDSGYSGTNDSGCWDTFEEALEAAIKMIITMKCD